MKPRNLILTIAAAALAVLLGACRPTDQKAAADTQLVQAMNRGVSFMGQYEYDQAAKAFEEAVAAAPELLEAKVNLAISLFNRGRKEDQDMNRSRILLDEVLAKDPAHLRALYFRGIILQHIGKAEEAISCFEKVVQQQPEDGAAWYLLGLCQQRLGQSANEALLRAVKLRPGLYSAYYQLYQISLRAGDTEKAKEYLEQFKSLRESPLGESIELPQYNQMGDLALVRPLDPQPRPITKSRFSLAPTKVLFEQKEALLWRAGTRSGDGNTAPLWELGGVTVGDLNQDGYVDIILTAAGPGLAGRLILLQGNTQGGFTNATAGSGLEGVRQALSCALGDFDNDGKLDLFVACAGENYLFKGNGNGTLSDVTQTTGTSGGAVVSRSALFIDADHDGDLDLFVCNAGAVEGQSSVGNQLLNNNGDGTFTDLALQAGVACGGSQCVMVLAGDLDGDRDADLVILRTGAPAKVFFNDLSGHYHEALETPDIRGDLGGALQDFNGDGHLDILALGTTVPQLRLHLGDGRGRIRLNQAFDDVAKSAASWGPIRGLRVADVDLDGDLDIALFGRGGNLLWNVGSGKFVWQAQVWPENGALLAGAELLDFTGDLVPDLLRIDRGAPNQITLVPSQLVPPSTGLALAPSGMRGRDGRTRSPASGYGVKAIARTGLQEQTLFYCGQAGGPNQSWLPLVLGLGGARKADYVRLQWPDGVAQVEIGLAAGTRHSISELQRKISSCPVLFAWNGQRFEFITDFAGVGGLGYYASPGESAPPQVLEHVKIEPDQLCAKDGVYELRITEPMEETAYVDRLELLAIDHPRGTRVFPDERLALSGPMPTHNLLALDMPVFPVRAVDPEMRDCTERLLKVDRLYAYDPPLDRRYLGYCHPHTLELDFGDRLAQCGSNEPVFLFIRGYIEYPYSQTVYAAAQSAVKWEPIRVDRQKPDGEWETLVPDAGVPGGMDRTMTIDLTGGVGGSIRKLRITTNLEIYYDQIFLAKHLGLRGINVRSVPLLTADLRRVGFAREYSPDGRLPLIYDYELSENTAPFHVLHGAYTRYGSVKELLEEFDDQYALVGPGDEIALRFDASKLPAPADGVTRSFVLVSHAYCKDMDLYTATPQTLEPLPFRGMSRYPYPATERYPETQENQRYRATYNTRMVE